MNPNKDLDTWPQDMPRPAVFDEYPEVKTKNMFNDNVAFYQIHGIGSNFHTGLMLILPLWRPTANGFLTYIYGHAGLQDHGFVTLPFTRYSNTQVYLDQNISIFGGGLLIGGGFKMQF